MQAHGERQVSATLAGIRRDHTARYEWACSRLGAAGAVLDAGCGVGYGSSLLSECAGRVIGVDISAAAIAYATEFWRNERVRFEVQDLHFLELPAQTRLDAVAAFECLEHLAAPALFLLRLRRYCSSQTRFFFSTPNQDVLPYNPLRNPYHFQHYTRVELDALLKSVGFELAALRSQDDDAVREDEQGRFWVFEARMLDTAPALTVAQFEAELPWRQHEHVVRLAREIAKAQSGEAAASADAFDTAVLGRVAVEAQQRAAVLEQRVEALEREARERAHERTAWDIQLLQNEVAALKKANLATRGMIKEIWDHPAIRRLARFNYPALKLLGLFGFQPWRRPGGLPSHAPAASTAPAKAPALTGTPAAALPHPHDTYVRGYAALSFGPRGEEYASSGKRLAIDVSRLFTEHLTGVGHYCDHLTRALLRQSPHAIAYYSGTPLPDWLLACPDEPRFYQCPPEQAVRDFAKASRAPALDALAGPYDVFLDVSASYHPIVKAHTRLACVYDLAPIYCPESVPEAIVAMCKEHARWQAGQSQAIIAISAYTKQSFIDFTGIDEGRVRVIPVALDPAFRKPIMESDRGRVRTRYALDQPYILCVGTLQPRKNLIRLLEAYEALSQQERELPQLVLTGTDKWADLPAFRQRLDDLHARGVLRWTGYVDRYDMPALYQMCDLFVYPSYFEGYGMPVAEAMACGVPVVCGDRTSLPEVAGDAAIYCDPFDVESIAGAMLKGLQGDAAELRRRSLARAQTFLTWDDVAEQYLEALAPLVAR